MISFILAFVTRYVPKNTVLNPFVPIISANDFESFAPNDRNKIICVIPHDNSKYVSTIISRIADAAIEFEGSAAFGAVYDHTAETVFPTITGMNSPFVVFLKGYSIVSCAQLPDDDDLFSTILFSWLTPQNKPTISNMDQLKMYLGSSSAVILAPYRSYQDASMIVSQIQPMQPSMDFLILDDDFYEDLGLPFDGLGVFRLDDQIIVPTTKLVEDVLNSSIPLYHIFSQQSLEKIRASTVILIDKFPFNSTHRETLEKLGQKVNSSEFLIGFPSTQLADILAEIFNITEFPAFIGFDFARGFNYKSSEINFSTPLNDEWIEKALNYLDLIRNNKIKKTFMSEPVPETQDPDFPMLVGDTFEEFVLNQSYDAIVVFVEPSQMEKIQFIKEMAREIKQKGITGIKFAFINPAQNSCEMEFPIPISSPNMEIWPANNKTKHAPYCELPKLECLKRWLNVYNTQGVKFEVPECDFEEYIKVVDYLQPLMKRLPKETAEAINVFLESLPKFEIDETIQG